MGKKEVAFLEDLTSKIKAIIEAQAVLRDGMLDVRRYLKVILEKMEEFEATSEVLKLSLRRKIDVEEMAELEKKIVDIEKKLPIVRY